MTALLYLSFIIIGALVYLRLHHEETTIQGLERKAVNEAHRVEYLKHREQLAYERYMNAMAMEQAKKEQYRQDDLFVLVSRPSRQQKKPILFPTNLNTPLTEDKIA